MIIQLCPLSPHSFQENWYDHKKFWRCHQITPIVRGDDAMLSTPHLAASYVTSLLKWIGLMLYMLFKIRKFVNDKWQWSIYFVSFESNLNYCSLVWAQNYNAIIHLVILQRKKALRTKIFQPRNSHIYQSFI